MMGDRVSDKSLSDLVTGGKPPNNIARVKGNISKMLEQGAPEADIDAYVAGEGISLKDLQAPAAPTESPAGDLAKSAGTGLRNAAIGAASMGGDMRDLTLSATENLVGRIGGEGAKSALQSIRPYADKALQFVGPLSGNTSAQNTQAVENVLGPEYKPQTNLGRYTKGTVEFLPAAVLPGGSGKVRAASAIAGGLGSVGGGDIAAATLGEDKRAYGELAGGLVGSVAPTTFAKSAQTLLAPATKDLKAAYKAGQQSPEVQNLIFDPRASMNEAGRIQSVLERAPNSFRERNVPQTFRELREGLPGTMTFDDLNAVRKNLNDVAQANRGMPEATAAGMAKKEIDKFLENMKPADVLFGDPAKASQTMKTANKNYSAAKRGELLDEAVAKAERQSGRAGAGQNFENALRQKLSQIRENPKKIAAFNDEERKLMDKIIKGSFSGNLLRHVGKLAPNGVVSTSLGGGIGAGIGSATGNDPLTSAGIALGIGGAARGLSNRNTLRKVQELNAKTRSRAPLAPAGARSNDINPRLAATLRALLMEGNAIPLPMQQRQKVE